MITIHGYKFEVDTCDWGVNSADGERAGELLLEMVEKMPAETIRQIWTALRAGDYDAKCLRPVYDAQSRAVNIIQRDWYLVPDSGHNCELIAIDTL